MKRIHCKKKRDHEDTAGVTGVIFPRVFFAGSISVVKSRCIDFPGPGCGKVAKRYKHAELICNKVASLVVSVF